MIYCIIAIISIICSCSLTYIVLRPKLRQIQKYDFEVEQLNYKLLEEKEQLKKDCDLLSWDKEHIQADILFLKSQRDDVQNSIDSLKNQAQQSADIFYEQAMKIAEQRLDADLALEERAFGDAQGKAQDEYLQTLEECVDNFQKQIVDKQAELDEIDAELADRRNKLNAAIEQAKRQAELQDNTKFYQVILNQEDLDEVKALLSIEYLLRNKRNLRMLLWTSYYSKAVNDLAGRVLGNKTVTGIYKITNIQTQQVYIGQAKDIRSRWRDHVKAGGLDIDRPSTNDFYKNMQQYGIENFTFELQEECSIDKLNDREKYWIDFFQSKTYGLNGNAGGA